MGQQVKAPASKSDDLSLTPIAHMVAGHHSYKVSFDTRTHLHTMVPAHACANKYINIHALSVWLAMWRTSELVRVFRLSACDDTTQYVVSGKL